jgi:hypothetical protein
MRLKIYGVMVIFMFVGLAVADYSAAADYDAGISLQLVKEKTEKRQILSNRRRGRVSGVA